MAMYSADDVANAMNNMFVTLLAPLIATHPEWEALYDRFCGGVEETEGCSDPALILAHTVLRNLVNAIDREIEAGSSPD